MGYDIGLMLDWIAESFDDAPPELPDSIVLSSIERYYPEGLRGFVANPPELCHAGN